MATFRPCDNGWVRYDENDPGHAVHVSGRSDSTPAHSVVTGYDSRCAWCWLGHSHSAAAHTAAITP